MAFYRLVFPLLVLSVVQCFASQVPVFLWGNLQQTSQKSNPLTSVTKNEFNGILDQELDNKPFTVVFVEETLSVEDFSLKSSDGETSFPYLHAQIGKAVYLPSVTDALHQLTSFTEPEKIDHVKLTENGLSADIEENSDDFLIIYLNDAKESESRSELLRRHNDFIQATFKQLHEKYPSLVAIYTAKNPSWTIPDVHSRVRRQAVSNSSQNYVMDNLILYAERITLTSGGNVENLTFVGSTTNKNNSEMDVVINFGTVRLTLNFLSKRGYWSFTTITVNSDTISETLYPTEDIYALHGFSYRCGPGARFGAYNDTRQASVQFYDMQIEAFFESNTTIQFSDAFDCVGFFSVAIWAGLMVTFILLSILFYGISMMLDIRTMDRFDDPKGKTITINTSE